MFTQFLKDNIVALSTISVAVFTCLLFVATILLWYGGEKNSERALRAYVSGSPDFIYNFNPTTLAAIRFSIDNHGQTPAYEVTQSAIADIFPYPLPANFPFPNLPAPGPSKMVVHPGSPFKGTVNALRLFTQSEIDQVVIGNHFRIYIFGILRYRDAFKSARETKFCSSIVGSQNLFTVTQGAPGPIEIGFEPCDQHNEAN